MSKFVIAKVKFYEENMQISVLSTQYETLPENLKNVVIDFMVFFYKNKIAKATNTKRNGFGIWVGDHIISDDFKKYMI